MLTEFFNRKKVMRLACAVCVVLVCLSIAYASLLARVKSVEINASFYFLVSDDTRVEAGAEFVKWDGGAGYLLENEGAQWVAFSVFLDRESGQTVQKRLTAKGEDTSLLRKGTQTLYFKGKEKKNTSLYVNALKLFKSYISLLNEAIARLQDGMTQEACKRILNTLAGQLFYAHQAYGKYVDFSKVCLKSGEYLQGICGGIVFAKDLRYLLCWQAEKYVELCEAFSI